MNKNGRNQSVTSFDVAKQAGVSQSSVSLVMSGKAERRVSDATQDRIRLAAQKLGYRPNTTARMLRTGKPSLIALAVPNVRQPFFSEILFAAELTARQKNYAVLLIDTSNDDLWVDRIIDMIQGRMIAGCIVYASSVGAEPNLAEVRDQILFIEGDESPLSGIDLNAKLGIRKVIEHITSLGHRQIGYFGADYPKAIFDRRFRYFQDELDRHGVVFDPSWRAVSTFDIDRATRCAERLLTDSRVTAVFCDDDLLAAGVYRAARRLDISIPDKLSVVGFNDVELARMLYPELTTLAIPADKIAQEAVHRLLDQIDLQFAPDREPLIIPLELKIRSSTGPVSTFQ